MRSTFLAACMLLLPMWTAAQDLPKIPTVPKLTLPKFDTLETSSIFTPTQDNPFKVAAPTKTLRVLVPADTPADKLKEIQDLLKKLGESCPLCSDSGTVRGPTVMGGAATISGTELFRTTGGSPFVGYVQITKLEYDELKRKAGFYDKLFSTQKK